MTTEVDRLSAENAILVVAGRVLANMCRESAELWEDYPEIGEHDWAAVVEAVKMLANQHEPQDAYYDASYALLASRAEDES